MGLRVILARLLSEGSIPFISTSYLGLVAQSGERRPVTSKAAGSKPVKTAILTLHAEPKGRVLLKAHQQSFFIIGIA
jgi:hypothetical protein